MKTYQIYILRAVSILLFLAIAISMIGIISNTMIPKRTDGITTMKGLYRQPENSIDLLVIGSSHAGMNLDAAYLWEEHGIASYMLWGSMQPFWNSYYFLYEALKTQTPKVVLLETYAATFHDEYSDDARQITNVAGMKWSDTKWEAIQATTEEENWNDFALGMPLWHNRYAELTEDDFSYYPWSADVEITKGTGIRLETGTEALKPMPSTDMIIGMHEKQELYLRKIFELCRERQIPLVLFNSVTNSRDYEQPFYNHAAKLAAEYGCPYINMNLLDNETGINSSDLWSDNSHLNTYGARKMTAYLANYLKAGYDLPDRRGDATYQSWDVFAQRCREEEALALQEQNQ